MLKRATPETALWVAVAVALATIAGAWIFEWWGYAPCYLCLLQRWPYYAAILLLPVTAIATGNAPWIRRPALWAFALLFAGSAVFGLYHAGVEWKWWPGPTTCGGGGQLTGLPDLTKTVVMCDEAALRIFGLSLAGWNAVISAALAAWLLRASLHSNLRSNQPEKLL